MSDGLKLLSSAISNGAGQTLLGLSADLFVQDELVAYEFVRGYFRSYRTLQGADTVRQETNVRLPIANEPIAFYVDQLYQRQEYNLIRDQFGALRDALSNRNVQDARGRIATMARIVRGTERRGRAVMRIDEAAQAAFREMELTRGYGGVTGVTSGWEGMDQITGGYQPADVITIVGRPSLGKTYVLLKQADAAHQSGENVLFVTTEMGMSSIARRHASVRMGVNPTLLKRNEISTHVMRRIQNMYREMMGADRFNIFSVGMGAKVNSIEALIHEYGPSVVYIDGAYLLRPTDGSKTMNRTERITAVFDELKALNLDVELPIVVTSQFNRMAGKGGKEGSLETIGYTDAIGTHSSVIAALKVGPTENPYDSRMLEFLKGREGESGEIAFNFKFAPLNMNEFTPEQRAAEEEAAGPTNLDWMQR